MHTEQDVSRIVRSWLRTDEHESANRVLGEVLAVLDATPQRRAWWPVRRIPDMNGYAKFAVAAVAVVAVVVVTINMLSAGGTPEQGGTPPGSPSPSPRSSPSSTPVASTADRSLYRSQPRLLEAGTYVVDQVIDRRITIDVPANWTSLESSLGQALLVKTRDALPFGTVPNTALLGIYNIDSVFADPCHDAEPIAPPPQGVEAVIDAITHATDVEGGPISDAVLGGLPAKTFELTNTVNMDDCLTQPFSQWTFKNRGSGRVGNHTSSGPGDHQRIWVIEVDGEVLLVNADTGANDYPDDMAELFEIVDGLRIE